MAQTKTNKPDIIQSFDKYIDREYYKIVKGFFTTSDVKVRADRIKEWKEWRIECDTLPDKVIINGEEYKLIKQDEPHKHVSDGLVYTSIPPKSRCIECSEFYR